MGRFPSNKMAEDAMIIVAGGDPPRPWSTTTPPFQPKTRVCVGKCHFKMVALGFPSANWPFPKSPKSIASAGQYLPLGEILWDGKVRVQRGAEGGSQPCTAPAPLGKDRAADGPGQVASLRVTFHVLHIWEDFCLMLQE